MLILFDIRSWIVRRQLSLVIIRRVEKGWRIIGGLRYRCYTANMLTQIVKFMYLVSCVFIFYLELMTFLMTWFFFQCNFLQCL